MLYENDNQQTKQLIINKWLTYFVLVARILFLDGFVFVFLSTLQMY